MGRLKQELLDRVEVFSHRVLDVVDVLEKQGGSRRILDQMTGAGTAIGANTWEADEALSSPDFCKTLGIVLKELSETRFWLRVPTRRGWLKPNRLASLQQEALELRRILGSIVARTKARTRKK